jgi:hypothetical protein
VKARRIVDELVKLHKVGAIKNEQNTSFYEHLIRDFSANFVASNGAGYAQTRSLSALTPARSTRRRFLKQLRRGSASEKKSQ